MTDLKPCPFCATPPTLKRIVESLGWFRGTAEPGFDIECPNCGASTGQDLADTPEEAAERWNARPYRD